MRRSSASDACYFGFGFCEFLFAVVKDLLAFLKLVNGIFKTILIRLKIIDYFS